MNRSSGKVAVDRSIGLADRQQLFPWRPKWAPYDAKGIVMCAAAAALMMAYTVTLATSGGYAWVATVLVFGALNFYKLQFLVNPPPASPGSGSNRAGSGVTVTNLIRSAGLAAGAGTTGMLLFWTLPDALVGALGKTLPAAMAKAQWLIIQLGTCLSCFIVSAYYR